MRHRLIGILIALVVALAGARTGAAQAVDEQTRNEALRHYRAGQELLYAEQFERAASEFEQAIKLDNLLTLAHYGLGQAHMGLKDYPGAVRAFTNCREAFRQIHDLQQRDTRTAERLRNQEIQELKDSLDLLQHGATKYVNSITVTQIEGRIRDLERDRQRSLTGQFVPPAEVSLALGSAYFRGGNLDDAEKNYRASVEANPKLAEAHNNLAAICLMTKRYDEADTEAKLAEKNGFKVHPQMKEDIKRGRQGS